MNNGAIAPHPVGPAIVKFGGTALLDRLAALQKEMDGVRKGEDIEHVHRMRVASRRLRNALRDFAEILPKRKADGWRKEIKQLTRALGAARDTDVQLSFLHEFLREVVDPDYRPGLRRLILRMRQLRNTLQKKVERALDKLENSGVLDEMEQELRESTLLARVHETASATETPSKKAYVTISLKLSAMLDLEDYLSDPKQIEKHHALRIAVKHLRYSVEEFAPLFEGELKEPIRILKNLQDRLGQLHDYDVWIQYLPEFVAEETQRTEEYFGYTRPVGRIVRGVDYLRNECRKRRYREHQATVTYWKSLRQKRVWESLQERLRDACAVGIMSNGGSDSQ